MTVTPIERKPRCLRLVVGKHGKNPCPNEALDDYGLCLKHLREAAEHWASIVADAVEQFPGLGRILS